MPASELARRALYARLEEVLGHEHAETLMTHLPPHEADNLATNADVQVIGARFDGLETRFDRLEARFDGLESRFDGLETRFDRLETRFDRLENRFDGMDERFYGLQETMRDQLRSYTLTTIWSMTALTGIFSAIVVILR